MRLLGLALFACFLPNRTKNQGITLKYQANIYGKTKKEKERCMYHYPLKMKDVQTHIAWQEQDPTQHSAAAALTNFPLWAWKTDLPFNT